LGVSWHQKQVEAIRDAESIMETEDKKVSAKKRTYANIGKIRAAKGI